MPEDGMRLADAVPADRPHHDLGGVRRLMNVLATMPGHGLTTKAMAILLDVWRREKPGSTGDLVEAIGLGKERVSVITMQLVGQGLLRATPRLWDFRRLDISLTPEGLRLMETLAMLAEGE